MRFVGPNKNTMNLEESQRSIDCHRLWQWFLMWICALIPSHVTSIAANWSTQLNRERDQEYWSSVPAIGADDSVFIASSRGNVVALNGATGSEVWRRRIGEITSLDLLMAIDSVIVVGTRSDNESALVGLNSANGEVIWQHAIGRSALVVPGAASPDGVVYASTIDTVMAFRAQDGAPLWSTGLMPAFGGASVDIDRSSMAVGHGLVVVANKTTGPSGPGTLCALDIETGAVQWTLPNVSAGGVVPLGDGTFIAGLQRTPFCNADGFLQISVSGKIQHWRLDQTAPTCWLERSGFSLLSQDVFLAGSDRDGFLRSINGLRSVQLIPLPNAGSQVGQPTATADGRVHDIRRTLGPNGKYVHYLATYASMEWSWASPFEVARTELSGNPTTPTVTPSGTIVVVSPDTGRVVGVEGTAALAPTHWPKARGDRANTACEPSVHQGPPHGVKLPPNRTYPAGSSIVLKSPLLGARPMTVEWYHNGNRVGTTANAAWTIPSATALDSGLYHFVASNALGSVTSRPTSVEVTFDLRVLAEGLGTVLKSESKLGYTTLVRLEAVPSAGSVFQGWTGDVTTKGSVIHLEMNRSYNVRARFSPAPRRLKYLQSFPELDTRAEGIPAIGPDGTVYYCHGNKLYAIERETGKVLWHFEDSAIGVSSTGVLPMVLEDGSILLRANRELMCIDGTSHTNKWRTGTTGKVWIGEKGGVMEYSEPDGKPTTGVLTIREATSGRVLWEGKGAALSLPPANWITVAELNRNRVSGSIPGTGSDFYGWSASGLLGAWNEATGAVKWLASPMESQGEFQGPILGPDNLLFVVAATGRCEAYDAEDGSLRWSTLAGGAAQAAPSLAADGTLFVTVSDALVGLDAATGNARWSYEFKDVFGFSYTKARTAPAISDDGVVYIGTDLGLAAIQVNTPLADTPWPKVHGNLQNAGRRERYAPILLEKPIDETLVYPGATVQPHIVAIGNPAPTLQWYVDGQPLLDQTNSTFRVAALRTPQGQAVTLIASNALGSIQTPPFYVFGADQAPVPVMGLRIHGSVPTVVSIFRGKSFNGPWIYEDAVQTGKEPLEWNDLSRIAVGDYFYRCKSDADIEVVPLFRNAYTMSASLGSRHIIEYVDAASGWANWQHLTNITMIYNPMFVLDPKPFTSTLRYYRVRPADPE